MAIQKVSDNNQVHRAMTIKPGSWHKSMMICTDHGQNAQGVLSDNNLPHRPSETTINFRKRLRMRHLNSVTPNNRPHKTPAHTSPEEKEAQRAIYHEENVKEETASTEAVAVEADKKLSAVMSLPQSSVISRRA